jgi:hypothetical protein
MKRQVYFFFFVFLSLFKVSNAQKHYIVEYDRINASVKYKQKTFDKGRPVEKDIKQPSLLINDLITIRVVNFNELLYGLVIDGELEEKDKSVLEDILDKSAGVMRFTNMSASADLMSDLLSSTPTSITRGSTSSAVLSLQKRFTTLVSKVATTQSSIKSIIYDEGLTKQEMLERVTELEIGFGSVSASKELIAIKADAEKLSFNDNDESEVKFRNYLGGYNLDEIEMTENTLLEVASLLKQIDFIQEKTIQVEKNSYSSKEYEAYNLVLKIYKRAEPIKSTSDLKLTIQHYDYDYGGKREGDILNQLHQIRMPIAYRYKLYFSVGVNRIFVPENRFSYSIEEDFFGDSVQFVSNRAGGSRFAVGLHLNYDLPIRSQKIATSANIGYFVSFSENNNNKLASETRKGFFTTGVSFKFLKVPYIAFHTGAAWSRFQQLSSKYQADKWYENTISESELEAQISNKTKPAFYVGFSLNL